jgi:hypothetical protein
MYRQTTFVYFAVFQPNRRAADPATTREAIGQPLPEPATGTNSDAGNLRYDKTSCLYASLHTQGRKVL